MLYEDRSIINQAKPKEGQNQCPESKRMKSIYFFEICNTSVSNIYVVV